MSKIKILFYIILTFFIWSCEKKESKPNSDLLLPGATVEPEKAQTTTLELSSTPTVLMSPTDGKLAFTKIYEMISSAKKNVNISIYSWSDNGLDDAIESALNNKALVKVVIDPALKDSPKVLKTVPLLESKGAEFKISPMNMHEKFITIDDQIAINTSANFSSGAQNKYSENIIFHEAQKDKTNNTTKLISDINNEFSIIWNVSKDIITKEETISEKLNYIKFENIPSAEQDIIFYSSSMNWTLKDNLKTDKKYLSGRYQSLVAKKDSKTNEQTWIIRDLIIEKIKSAKKSIYLSLNHFNIRMVSDELIEAVKRGIDVKLAVDNQEFKLSPNNLEMTPQFVQDWVQLKPGVIPPVRVKYYSHEPSPRSWLLNHHKFILIDYENPESTILLSGSYNLSKNAEQNQFDNFVLYKTQKYRNLYKSFYEEFQNQWSWNRTSEDKPKLEILNLFFTAKEELYPIHIKEAVSLTWPEIIDVRSQINAKAPGIFNGLSRNNNCLYYNPTTKSYSSCPN